MFDRLADLCWLVERQNHLACQHARGIFLLVHGPDDVAGLGDSGFKFASTIAGSFKNRGKVARIPMLKNNGFKRRKQVLMLRARLFL